MKNSELTLDLRSYSSISHSHQHDYHQLVLPVVGEMSMNIGKCNGSVASENVAVIAAGQEHGFSGSQGNVFVVADIPETLAPNLKKLPPFIELDPALAQYVRFLYTQLSEENRSESCERQMLLLLIQLLQDRFGQTLRLDRRIEAAQAYLDTHYQKTITLKGLSKIANISPRQLSALFAQHIGMSPQQYLTEKRMQTAWQLLKSSTFSIQGIAEQSGYTNIASFSDRFRKHFGHPPSYFRKNDK